MEKKDYPRFDPVSQEREEMWRRFVDKFNLKDFLGKIPDPEEHYYGILIYIYCKKGPKKRKS